VKCETANVRNCEIGNV